MPGGRKKDATKKIPGTDTYYSTKTWHDLHPDVLAKHNNAYYAKKKASLSARSLNYYHVKKEFIRLASIDIY